MSDTTMTPAPAAAPSPKSTSLGIDENIAGALAYFFGLFTGVLFFLLEKDNKFVKFHALQSIMLSIALVVIFVPLNFLLFLMPDAIAALLSCASFLASFAFFFLWIFLMYKAYTGEMYKLPVIGDMAHKEAMK